MTSISDDLPIEITDRYDIVNNTFIGKDKGEKHAELEVEIGDIYSDTFQPQFKINRWENECNFSIRLIDDVADAPKLQTKGNKIKFIKKKTETHFFDVPKTDEMPECYEFEIILKEKPVTNKVQMSIETKGLVFYYQPELTQKEIDEGCFRPENVIGSYAVYHDGKQGDYSKMGLKNYRAGKAFHIYRPKIIDNAGKEVWGKLNITDNLLTVEIPQEFLDNAMYPVIVDPTFGYETIGGSNGIATVEYITGSLSTGAAGTGNSITIYNASENGTNKCKYALYKHSDSTKVTNGETDELTIPASWAWRTLNFGTNPTLEAIDYVIVTGFEAAASPNRTYGKFDTGDTDQGHYETITYPTFPATASFNHDNRRHSIYCTYTAGNPFWYYQMLRRRNQ